MAEVTDDQLKQLVENMVPKIDLETTGLKKFIKLMSKEVGYDLKSKKDYIKAALTDVINKMGDGGDNDDDDEDDEEIVESVPEKKKGGGGGLAAKKEITSALATFLGVGKDEKVARTEIVKRLWNYIRENNLQNPENKREIFLDSDMKAVFGCDTFTMFSMNKYIGAHVHPYKPVDLTTNSTPSKKRKSKAKGSSEKKKRKKAINQPIYSLSDALAEIVGASTMSRPQVVKKLWEYIRENDLQNPEDKREILCDAKLEVVMKRQRVTMFNMNTFLSDHILEKVGNQSDLAPAEEDDGDD